MFRVSVVICFLLVSFDVQAEEKKKSVTVEDIKDSAASSQGAELTVSYTYMDQLFVLVYYHKSNDVFLKVEAKKKKNWEWYVTRLIHEADRLRNASVIKVPLGKSGISYVNGRGTCPDPHVYMLVDLFNSDRQFYSIKLGVGSYLRSHLRVRGKQQCGTYGFNPKLKKAREKKLKKKKEKQ